jgi:pimeloyl-ACP methyl ester carboxylesterase
LRPFLRYENYYNFTSTNSYCTFKMTSRPQTQSQDAQTLKLPDGRTLGYAIYGSPLSPHVPKIFYFHGFPTSRIEATFCVSVKTPTTVIAIDRPGMGLSSFQTGRRILDWPSDVLAVADHLNIERFHVIGDSGGAPFALVCTKEIPRTRLLSTAVVSGIYPLSLGTQGMLFPVRALLFAGSYLPRFITKKFLDLEFGTAARNPDSRVFEEQFMKAMETRSERDRKCLEDEGIRRVVVESMREGFRQGSEGPAWELGLFGEWGFELGKVDGQGVVLWHGRGDVNAPCAMAEKAAGLMKGCELRVVEEETHLSLPLNHLQEVLEGLVEGGARENSLGNE